MLARGYGADVVYSEELIDHKLMRCERIVEDFAAPGNPTPLSPLFLGRFSPVLRRFSAVVLCCLASWRQDGENGRKMAENGRNLGEKRPRNSGG